MLLYKSAACELANKTGPIVIACNGGRAVVGMLRAYARDSLIFNKFVSRERATQGNMIPGSIKYNNYMMLTDRVRAP